MTPAAIRKWVAFGAGIGVQISGAHGAESLHIAAVRVRPGGARVLGQFTIEDVTHQAAGVWGTDYAAFTGKLGLKHVPATVILPRQDVIVRTLALPGVAEKDLPAAVQFQLEGQHPYDEADVLTSWARLEGSSSVLVAIVRREVVERYALLFAEAGVKVGSFTCSAAAIHSGLRLFGQACARELLAFETNGERTEFYGESAARPVFSAAFDGDPARSAALAAAELRADPALEAQAFEKLVGVAPALPYAAALASACPRSALALNLLPVEQRAASSRALWIPATLAACALLLAGAVLAFPKYEDKVYLRSLQGEIVKVQPRAKRAAALDKEIDMVRQRTMLLDDIRRRPKADMDALSELTRILAPPTWLNSLELNRSTIQMAGEADQAAPLLKTIDSSTSFKASEFVMPPVRMQTGEAFRIRANRVTPPVKIAPELAKTTEAKK